VEEAIINALVAGETMTGANGRTVTAIPHDRLTGSSQEVQPARRSEEVIPGQNLCVYKTFDDSRRSSV
jgi:hypothetical protein